MTFLLGAIFYILWLLVQSLRFLWALFIIPISLCLAALAFIQAIGTVMWKWNGRDLKKLQVFANTSGDVALVNACAWFIANAWPYEWPFTNSSME